MREHRVALCRLEGRRNHLGGSSLTFSQVPSARRLASSRAMVTDVADKAVQATASVHFTSGDFVSVGGFLPVAFTQIRLTTTLAMRAAMVAATAE